jgi:predicted methyltransferase
VAPGHPFAPGNGLVSRGRSGRRAVRCEINANPKDKPSDSDMVWRLPPTLATSKDNPELKAQMEAIGETDRMTLQFKKPN